MKKWWISDNRITLATIAIATSLENPIIVTPNAVPDAGGCSVSIITMMKIEHPTASAYTIVDVNIELAGMRANIEPETRPTMCPPITFRDRAVICSGIANTTNVDAPMDATITILKDRKSKITMKIAQVAIMLWIK